MTSFLKQLNQKETPDFVDNNTAEKSISEEQCCRVVTSGSVLFGLSNDVFTIVLSSKEVLQN